VLSEPSTRCATSVTQKTTNTEMWTVRLSRGTYRIESIYMSPAAFTRHHDRDELVSGEAK